METKASDRRYGGFDRGSSFLYPIGIVYGKRQNRRKPILGKNCRVDTETD